MGNILVFIIVAAVLISLLLSNIKLDIIFSQIDKKTELTIKFGIGFLSHSLNVFERTKRSGKKHKAGGDKRTNEFSHDLKAVGDVAERLKSVLKKRLTCCLFELDMAFGLDDAGATGIVTGLLWAVSYNIFAFISNFIKVKEHKIKITPHFNALMINARFRGIFVIRVVHIIYILAVYSFYNLRKKAI